MPTTASFARPLLRAAVTSLLLFGLFAARAAASDGAGHCDGSLDVPNSSSEMTAAADSIVCLVNFERTNRDLPALRRDRDLAEAARGHALDMARHDYFSHVSRNGDTLGDRLNEAGYGRPGDGWRAGEDLGWGTGGKATPNALVDAWLDSPAPPADPALGELPRDRRRRRRRRAATAGDRPARRHLRDGPRDDRQPLSTGGGGCARIGA